MKIAAITDDGITISQHFGRAPFFLVLTIENAIISDTMLREKIGHSQFASLSESMPTNDSEHGIDSPSHDKHVSMADVIADCQVLLCGGMGMGAYESMRQLNIRPVVTDVRKIEEAVLRYLDGTLVDHIELLH